MDWKFVFILHKFLNTYRPHEPHLENDPKFSYITFAFVLSFLASTLKPFSSWGEAIAHFLTAYIEKGIKMFNSLEICFVYFLRFSGLFYGRGSDCSGNSIKELLDYLKME